MVFIKKSLIVIVMFFVVFTGYVLIDNRNTPNMTIRQKILKSIYPFLMWATKSADKNAKVLTNTTAMPEDPFYSLKDTLNNGKPIDFESLKGKKVLLVNTASDCGYTNQYADLQALHEKFKDQLVVIGFPANDFKEQEKANDDSIAEFCKVNFGVTFPLIKKSVVVKVENQNPVFKWLTDPKRNGWNGQAPSWNFSKYLINEKGQLTDYFDPSISPMGDEVLAAIKR